MQRGMATNGTTTGGMTTARDGTARGRDTMKSGTATHSTATGNGWHNNGKGWHGKRAGHDGVTREKMRGRRRPQLRAPRRLLWAVASLSPWSTAARTDGQED
jgi:hypothetical protein